MTGPLATTKTDRLKKIKLLQAMAKQRKDSGDQRVHGVGQSQAGFRLWDETNALGWALGFVERHVNLETGELTIPLDEPEEAA